MLYVFTCLSQECIGTQNAIQVHRAIVPHNNKTGVKFASDDEYDQIYDKTPNQLRALGIELPKDEKYNEDKEEIKADSDGE